MLRRSAALVGLVAGLAPWAWPAPAAAPASVPESLPGAPPLPAPLRERLASALAALGPDYVPRTRNRREDGSPRYTNRLLLETSPYLRQHAHNPVNWYPWGDEAFETARQLDRPVLVSIGYSTCHWCHVMEEESFDDPALAGMLNAHFVAIKVDREARPDVDDIYMNAVNAMGGPGGWPLNVWVTPDRKPFFGGTYFPPEDRGGRPGLPRVLASIHERWSSDRARFSALAEQVTAAVSRDLAGTRADASRLPGEDVLTAAARTYASRFDAEWGGLRQPQKFPSSLPVRFLLRYHRRSGDPEALDMAVRTLEKMAAGGMMDQLGGGFHRYSTDPRWLVPHFEKMLYDNALLALAYLEAWQVTGRDDFARTTHRVLDYLDREMRLPGGGFASATDADSPGPNGSSGEGLFFTWTPDEIDAALGVEDAHLAKAWYGVTPEGNIDGRTVLHAWRTPAALAKDLGVSPDTVPVRLEAVRARLYEVRQRRAPPLRDEKVLAAWNGLAISAFARAGFALGEQRYLDRAAGIARFVLEVMRSDGRLHRVALGGQAEGPAFLEDYAFVIAGLLDLYEASPDPRWLREAISLQKELDAAFLDVDGGGYWRTARQQARLIAREKPGQDGAIPSGNSVAVSNLLRLAAFGDDAGNRERALLLFSAFHDALVRAPTSLSEMLLALDFELDRSLEVIIVRPDGKADDALLDVLRAAYLPNRIVSIVTEGEDLAAHAELVPLLKNKVARGGRPTAYVCEDRVCRYPTSDPAKFAEQLARPKPIATGEAGALGSRR
jgi:hypothetical protein